MTIWKAMGIALSTYSILPLGRFRWEEKPMRYAICFLPLAGVLVGGALILWAWLCALIGAGQLLFCAVAAVIPALLTGGIHLDGYLDTVDALSSRAPRERKLEIMKDPRAGAFSVIWGGVYFLLSAGLFSELRFGGAVFVLGLGFVLSRALAAFAALTQRGARGEGFLQAFMSTASRRACGIAMAVLTLLLAAGMLLAHPLLGAAALAACALAYLICFLVTKRQFGGVTGDTCGFLITILELAMLLGVTAGTLLA